MRIVICYKCVPEEQDLKIRPDRTPDWSGAARKIGQYDLNAIEAGVRLAESAGGEVLALTAGAGANDSKLQKAVLSRGPAAMYGIKTDEETLSDSLATAYLLKAGIEKIGGVDLVLCGEGSGDIYARQVGPLLGALIGWRTLNAVSALSFAGGALRAERSLENSREVLRVDLPAVAALTTDANLPRIPGMKDILAAGKKPVTIWDAAEVSAPPPRGAKTVSILAPEKQERRQIIVEGESEESIAVFYGHLRKVLR
ncbi:MAG: putative electron transfer flavoprotein FixA [Gracilibacteraceae bacterium]|nr:putative electron transfer flavoprotein FixA [Gracilibacteraceae bacterium]